MNRNLYLFFCFFLIVLSFEAHAQIITTIAGTGVAGFTGDGGPATSAELNSPYGVAVDGSSNVYVADGYNNRIRKINPSGIITTFAGNGAYRFSGDGGPATGAELDVPACVAMDGSGNILIGDAGSARIGN